jgi:hypothetical protein
MLSICRAIVEAVVWQLDGELSQFHLTRAVRAQMKEVGTRGHCAKAPRGLAQEGAQAHNYASECSHERNRQSIFNIWQPCRVTSVRTLGHTCAVIHDNIDVTECSLTVGLTK